MWGENEFGGKIMELSKVQQEAVDFYEGCCNVIASAGSGKTRVLVNRIVKLIEDYDGQICRLKQSISIS